MSDPIDIVERLREALAADGDIPRTTSDMTQQQKVELAHRRASARLELETVCFNAAPVLLAEITRLRAALAAQGAQWRPIESAPKDGTEFLAFKRMVLGGPCVSVCTWLDSDHPDYDGETPHVAWDHSGFWNATHWMPLPAAPGASPQPVDLTDAQIDDLMPMGMAPHSVLVGPNEIRRFARAVVSRAMLASSPQAPADTQAQGPTLRSAADNGARRTTEYHHVPEHH